MASQSRLGRLRSASMSSAARAALREASAYGTTSGSNPAGCFGRQGLVGNAQHRPHVRVDVEADGRLARSPGFQARVNPPSRHGATFRVAFEAGGRPPARPRRPPGPDHLRRARVQPGHRRRSQPPTTRALGHAESRSQRRSMADGSWPASLKTTCIAWTTRCDASRGRSSAPNPSTATVNDPPASAGPVCASMTSCRSRARPSASKPGPRFALVAGPLPDSAVHANPSAEAAAPMSAGTNSGRTSP